MAWFDETVSAVEQIAKTVEPIATSILPAATPILGVVEAVTGVIGDVESEIKGSASPIKIEPSASSVRPATTTVVQNIVQPDPASIVAASSDPRFVKAARDENATSIDALNNRIAELERIINVVAPILGTLIPASAPLIRGIISDESVVNNLFESVLSDARDFSLQGSKIKSFFDVHLMGKIK